MCKSKKSYLKITAVLIAGIVLLFLQDLVLAAGAQDLKTISTGLTEQIKAVAQLLIIVSYVAGVGFALAGVIQFKAHKDNPTQVPLSKPIIYLIVGACLLFLPTLISASGKTIFGDDTQSAAKGVIE